MAPTPDHAAYRDFPVLDGEPRQRLLFAAEAKTLEALKAQVLALLAAENGDDGCRFEDD